MGIRRFLQGFFYDKETLDSPINFIVTPSGTMKSKYSLPELLQREKQRQIKKLSETQKSQQ